MGFAHLLCSTSWSAEFEDDVVGHDGERYADGRKGRLRSSEAMRRAEMYRTTRPDHNRLRDAIRERADEGCDFDMQRWRIEMLPAQTGQRLSLSLSLSAFKEPQAPGVCWVL